MISRDEANKLLAEKITDTYTLVHSKMVAHAMEKYAKKNNKEVDLYFITGLLHDLDWTKEVQENPDKHGTISTELLATFDCPMEMVQAIKAHASNHTGVMPVSNLDFALIACDEVCGLLHAYSLMRPEGFNGLKLSSLRKKFNDENFAAKIDRDLILVGVNGINTDIDSHLTFLTEAFDNYVAG